MFRCDRLKAKLISSLLLGAVAVWFFIIYCGWTPDEGMITMQIDTKGMATTLYCFIFALAYGLLALPLAFRDKGYLIVNLLVFIFTGLIRGFLPETADITVMIIAISFVPLAVGIGISLLLRRLFRTNFDDYRNYKYRRTQR